jgi:hypothetical protein
MGHMCEGYELQPTLQHVSRASCSRSQPRGQLTTLILTTCIVQLAEVLAKCRMQKPRCKALIEYMQNCIQVQPGHLLPSACHLARLPLC